MPKIVNRDEYKKELAIGAAGYFSQHGFAGVGMRGIAQHLGVSKSALYHYFPTKEALFLACTEVIMSRIGDAVLDNADTEEGKLNALMHSIRGEFGAEMFLVLEYLRGKNAQEIASDDAMQIAMKTFLHTVEQIVGVERGVATLENLIGKLMLDYLSGGTLSAISKK